jgi:hypothetical protein
MSSVEPIASVMALGAPSAGVGMDAPGAAAQQSFQEALHRPVTELQIAPGAPVDPLGGKMMERVETFYDRVQQYSADSKAPGSEQAGDGGAAQPAQKHAVRDIDQAMQMLHRTFSFVIETTLVSKVTSESTRTINTFMRGT